MHDVSLSLTLSLYIYDICIDREREREYRGLVQTLRNIEYESLQNTVVMVDGFGLLTSRLRIWFGELFGTPSTAD